MEIAKKIPSAQRETDEMMATSRPPGAGVLFRFFIIMASTLVNRRLFSLIRVGIRRIWTIAPINGTAVFRFVVEPRRDDRFYYAEKKVGRWGDDGPAAIYIVFGYCKLGRKEIKGRTIWLTLGCRWRQRRDRVSRPSRSIDGDRLHATTTHKSTNASYHMG